VTTDREATLKSLLALNEIERRKKVAPAIYFRPHPRQQEALAARKTHRVVILVGGNRSGKSECLAAEIVACCYGYRPWEVPGLELNHEGDYPHRSDVDFKHWLLNAEDIPLREQRRILVMTGLSMERGIGRVLWPKIESYLPPAVRRHPDLKIQRGSFGVPIGVTLPNGTEIMFGSKMQDPMMLEAIDVDVAFFDEPLPRSHWSPIWRSLVDHMGRCFFGMTPIGPDAPFVHQHFISGDLAGVALIQMSIHDNPTLSFEARRQFLDEGGFTAEELKARESGDWMFLTHRAFPSYDPAAHAIAPFHIPQEWQRGLCIDPAHRRPFALTWAAFGPHGEVVVYREWPEELHHKMRASTLTIEDYVTLIRNLEGQERVEFRILDPRFGKAEHSVKGQKVTSIQEDFAGFGMYFDCDIPNTQREETGIEEVRRLLKYDRTTELSVLNRPKLQVFTHCRNTLLSLAESNFVPPGSRDPDILPEKLLETHKDFRDNLRYIVLYDRPLRLSAGSSSGYISERDLEDYNE
jgi:hypothetical protein